MKRASASISWPGAASARSGAMFAAVDGGQRLWNRRRAVEAARPSRRRTAGAPRCASPAGPWSPPRVSWPCRSRCSVFGVVAALVGVLLSLVSLMTASTAVTSAYARSIDALFAPSALPTVIPRLIVFCLLVAIGALAAGLALDAWRAPARRRLKHGAIWRLLGAPLSNAVVLNRADRRVVEPDSRRRGDRAAGAAGSRAPLYRAAGRESRPAGIPRAAARRARHGRPARHPVRAPRRRPSAALLQPGDASGRGRPRR